MRNSLLTWQRIGVFIFACSLTGYSMSSLGAAPPKKAVANKTVSPAPKAAAAPRKPKFKEGPPTMTEAEEKAFKQMDPHGGPKWDLRKTDIDKFANCQTCHFMQGGKLSLQPEPENICSGCHGRLLHSGLVEHMGEEPGGGAGLNCLSCHRPHRAILDPSTNVIFPEGNTSIRIKRHGADWSPDVVDQRSKFPMLGHPCSECHSW